MAGHPGQSGGAWAEAARPKKEPATLTLSPIYDDPDNFPRAVMNDTGSDDKLRVHAATALLSAQVRRTEGAGKKEQKEAAEKVPSRFA